MKRLTSMALAAATALTPLAMPTNALSSKSGDTTIAMTATIIAVIVTITATTAIAATDRWDHSRHNGYSYKDAGIMARRLPLITAAVNRLSRMAPRRPSAVLLSQLVSRC